MSDNEFDFSHRHQSTQHMFHLFDYGHLPEGLPRTASVNCTAIAIQMIMDLKDGPELSAGLRKLVEAKDCFVRQAFLDARREMEDD